MKNYKLFDKMFFSRYFKLNIDFFFFNQSSGLNLFIMNIVPKSAYYGKKTTFFYFQPFI